MTVVSKQI